MNEKLIIPKQLHVGYQDRGDTYTGKLSYVIYTDFKGVKRKETSWLSWTSDSIPRDDFDNEPRSGFVLNKGVGGARESWGWNARNEYIRVFDPRGFEFEITVANLMFILQETTSVKGKGLEGEFVYSWDGKDLVLLPTSSFEYKCSMEHSKLQTKKITAKDMVIGCAYKDKKGETLVYMGRGNYVNDGSWTGVGKVTKEHVYAEVKGNSYSFISKSGFTHLGEKLSDEEFGDFPKILEDFQHTNHHTTPVKISLLTIPSKNNYHRKAFKQISENVYGVYSQDYDGWYNRGSSYVISHVGNLTLEKDQLIYKAFKSDDVEVTERTNRGVNEQGSHYKRIKITFDNGKTQII